MSIDQATNIRYRLMKGLPIRGWAAAGLDISDETKAEMQCMEDYLFNSDIARELVAGGREIFYLLTNFYVSERKTLHEKNR